MVIDVVAALLQGNTFQQAGVHVHLQNQISTVAEHNICNVQKYYITLLHSL
jgi:hypothetical protein